MMRPEKGCTEDNLLHVEKRLAGLPARWSDGILKFVDACQERFDVVAIILVGSVARGTWTPASDIDLLVISDDLPADFFERLLELSHLRPELVPLEILGYTTAEYAQMFSNGSVTFLYALAFGIPLVGVEWFKTQRKRFDEWVELGLTRTNCSWVLPPNVKRQQGDIVP